jgi:hypothetical protein
MTEAIDRSRDLGRRLQALGDDPAARGKALSVVIGSLGELAVVQSIAGAMPRPDHGGAALESELRTLENRLGTLDPECRAFEQLSGDRQRLAARLDDALKAQADSQADAARRLVGAARSGDLERIAELGKHATSPELARAVADARGTDAALIATVAEMGGSRP